MRIAVLFGKLCLSFRGSFDFNNLRSDPRGLTGSELGFVRIAQEMKALGHTVEVFTVAEQTEWEGMRVRPWAESTADEYDAAIAINEPDLLRGMKAHLRIVEFWLNDVTFCGVDFDKHVDLFVSPSSAHLEQVMTNEKWRHVAVKPDAPRGTHLFTPDPAKWVVNYLGCDPHRYEGFEKIPGRVSWCSSPDRGLHWLLQEWPKIRRAVPHAELCIYYRLEPWLRGFDNTPYFPPIEALRARALFVEESLRRFQALGGLGVTVCDSVSRERIEREMAQTECLAYSCDTTVWSEGFSCSLLESCAARACPISTDCDAFPSVYGGTVPLVKRGQWSEWSDLVIRALTDKQFRDETNERCAAFAAKNTWRGHAERLEREILSRLNPSPRMTETEFRQASRLEGSP